MKIAFYKGTRPGLAAIYSVGVRVWTRSKYSHCEAIFSDGLAASSSLSDGGVRFKQIDFDPNNWDFLEIPDMYEPQVREWFVAHEGQRYDIMGNIHFLVKPVRNHKGKWFCSEAVGAALGLEDAWRFSPGDLYVALKLLVDHLQAN